VRTRLVRVKPHAVISVTGTIAAHRYGNALGPNEGSRAMTGHEHDEDHEDTQLLPSPQDAAEPDTEATVVLGEEYRRRVEQSHDPDRNR